MLLSRGDGTLHPPATVDSCHSTMGVGTGDIDGDGDRDLATANQDGDNVSILRNTGGTFARTRTLAPTARTTWCWPTSTAGAPTLPTSRSTRHD